LTKTLGLPLTLESVRGPYVAEKYPELKQVAGPDDFVNFCLEKVIVLPVLEPCPDTLFAVYTQVTDPRMVLRTTVVLSGFEALVSLTVTGTPLESATATL
jgi:hypothetical protein